MPFDPSKVTIMKIVSVDRRELIEGRWIQRWPLSFPAVDGALRVGSPKTAEFQTNILCSCWTDPVTGSARFGDRRSAYIFSISRRHHSNQRFTRGWSPWIRTYCLCAHKFLILVRPDGLRRGLRPLGLADARLALRATTAASRRCRTADHLVRS
jgi:hypothetical protein